ncbi:MAG: hypothetical protein GF311_13240 [Candidatus Lokiarchaeota archaeon]|nr:hypothetical protein [Candidatus Lokiarchaeota archaeon]
MLELISYNQEVINTKDRVTIDLIKQGEVFIRQFDVNENLIVDTASIIYKYIRNAGKIPQNIFKYFIAAYYIISRHPMAFPAHQPKNEFCAEFGMKVSSLDYCVDKITSQLNYVRILDDMNYPYYLDPDRDIGYKLLKNIIQSTVEEKMMDFMLYHQPLNPQILSEELVGKVIFEMELFPEEMFRQFYDLINSLVETQLKDYNQYIHLQEKYFI